MKHFDYPINRLTGTKGGPQVPNNLFWSSWHSLFCSRAFPDILSAHDQRWHIPPTYHIIDPDTLPTEEEQAELDESNENVIHNLNNADLMDLSIRTSQAVLRGEIDYYAGEQVCNMIQDELQARSAALRETQAYITQQSWERY